LLRRLFNQFFTGAGFNLNYFFNSFERTGWLIGLEVHRGYNSGELLLDGILSVFDFVIENETDNIDENNAQLENRMLLSIGYQF